MFLVAFPLSTHEEEVAQESITRIDGRKYIDIQFDAGDGPSALTHNLIA